VKNRLQPNFKQKATQLLSCNIIYYLACSNTNDVLVLSTRQGANVPMIVDFDGKTLNISCIDKILGNVNDNLNFEYGLLVNSCLVLICLLLI